MGGTDHNENTPSVEKTPQMTDVSRQNSNDSFYSTESMTDEMRTNVSPEGNHYKPAEKIQKNNASSPTPQENEKLEKVEQSETGQIETSQGGNKKKDTKGTEKDRVGANRSTKKQNGTIEKGEKVKEKGRRQSTEKDERRSSKDIARENREREGEGKAGHAQRVPRQPYSQWNRQGAGPQPRVYEMGSRRTRVLMVANVKGWLGIINELALNSGATIAICCGNFGFFDHQSYDTVSISLLKERVKEIRPRGITEEERAKLLALPDRELRKVCMKRGLLGELPLYLSGKERFRIPVYTTWGGCEDLRVLEKFQQQKHRINNLYVLNERGSYKFGDIRIYGLGGDVLPHQLFNHGEGKTEIGGQGHHIWTTMLQLGRLLQTEERVQSLGEAREVRVLATHVAAGKNPLIGQLAYALQCDFAFSGQIKTRYCISHNHWFIMDPSDWTAALKKSRDTVIGYWDYIKESVATACKNDEMEILERGINLVKSTPKLDDIRGAWHVSLPDADWGCCHLTAENGKIAIQSFSDGIDYTLRKQQFTENTKLEGAKEPVVTNNKRKEIPPPTTTPAIPNSMPTTTTPPTSTTIDASAAPSEPLPVCTDKHEKGGAIKEKEERKVGEDGEDKTSDNKDIKDNKDGIEDVSKGKRATEVEKEKEGSKVEQIKGTNEKGERGQESKEKGKRGGEKEGERHTGPRVYPKIKHTAYVKGFPQDVTPDRVHETFDGLKIKDIVMQRLNGACFIEFEDEASLKQALASNHEVMSRRIIVDIARPRRSTNDRKPPREYANKGPIRRST